MHTSYYFQTEIIELLIGHGADRKLRDKSGKSALDHLVLKWKKMGNVMKCIMIDFLTRERHNKCINVLTSRWDKRFILKRWTEINSAGIVKPFFCFF